MKLANWFMIVILILVIIPLASANINYPKISCSDCATFFGDQGYCDLFANTCSLRETAAEIDMASDFEVQIQTLHEKVNTLATGLASTQNSLDSTMSELNAVQEDLEKEKAYTTTLTTIILSLIGLTIALAIIYFITNTKAQKINPEIINYMTQHIKAGKKYPQIKENLQAAGWETEEIEAAYKETMKHNYQRYKEKMMPASKSNKIILIMIMSILIILGIILLLRGTATGKAIEFGSQVEFEIAVQANLGRDLPNSQFYPLINAANLCVQVNDGQKSVSYAIIKTASGHTIEKAPLPCTEDITYDGAVIFTDWQSFNVVSRTSSCDNIRDKHGVSLYILPSTYVLPGFQLNPTKNYTPFCNALNLCLTPTEKAVVGC